MGRPDAYPHRRRVLLTAFLRTMGMSEEGASAAANQLELPMTLTMRGRFVYAIKG